MYSIKWLQEAGWAVLTAVAVFVLQAVVNSADVTDVRAWAVALAAGALRVAAAELLNHVQRPGDPIEE